MQLSNQVGEKSMKMIKKCTLVIAAAVLSTAVLVSCGAALNEDLYNETVGKRTETIPPANVSELEANIVNNAVSLKWVNPTDKDFYGLTISATPAVGTLEQPMTFINEDKEQIPTSFNVNNLPGNVSYTFTVKTFDYNMNYSSGASVTAKPDGDNATATGNFFGTGKVFGYKRTKSAFDFGYCSEPTTREIEVYATNTIDISLSTISNSADPNKGKFELVDYSPKGNVKIGEKITLKVKYTPTVTPVWDEVDLLVGGLADSKLTLIGSSFMQPNNISISSENRTYGLKLWLRADLISEADLVKKDKYYSISRIPDYSGRELHAYSTSDKYNPAYEDESSGSNEFNGLPTMNFEFGDDTKKGQLLTNGNRNDPIIDSEKGSTTFVICKVPKLLKSGDTSVQSVISSNYGYTYPTLLNTYRYYDENPTDKSYKYSLHRGWAVRGSGLYKDYRFPCVSNNDGNDGNENSWLTNEVSEGKATTMCMWFNMEQSPNAVETSHEKYNYVYPSNIRMIVDGSERLLSYIYTSTRKSTDAIYSGTTCYGAYGNPVSDGKGHRYLTLGQYETSSSSTSWQQLRDNINRYYDFGLSYSPMEYKNASGTSVQKYTQSYASSDTTEAANFYYTNWISNESRRNGTVYSVTVGADNTNAKTFNGKVAEVIMFDYPLSDEEIATVNNYIYYRYGIGSAQ